MQARLIFHGAWRCQLGRTVGRVGEEEGSATEESVDGRMRKEQLLRRVCALDVFYDRPPPSCQGAAV